MSKPFSIHDHDSIHSMTNWPLHHGELQPPQVPANQHVTGVEQDLSVADLLRLKFGHTFKPLSAAEKAEAPHTLYARSFQVKPFALVWHYEAVCGCAAVYTIPADSKVTFATAQEVWTWWAGHLRKHFLDEAAEYADGEAVVQSLLPEPTVIDRLAFPGCAVGGLKVYAHHRGGFVLE